MEAITLGGAVGWYHPANGGRGVVIVGAHGYEDLCSRVTLRIFADDLAAAGLPTLRLDPRDTGDAVDLAPGDDRVAAWKADVVAAVRFMRETVGVSDVALVGLRVGALLAGAVAAELGDIDRVVLMAPPPNGRAHARELSVLARLVDGTSGGVRADGAIEIAGFRLDAPTLAGLAEIDLTALPQAPARKVTLVGDVGSAGLGRIAAALETRGAEVEQLPFTGYARMMCDPTASEPATEAVATVVADLARGLPAARIDEPKLPPGRVDGGGWSEERFVFGDGLAGVLCLPAGATPPRRTAIWLNSGRNHHIGWARQAVEMSRRLAENGVAVLRFDLAGIGDSPARADTPAAALYHPGGRVDVDAAIAELERRGLTRPWLIGACSGAYQAYHIAVDDPRITGIVLVNQLCFIWDASYAVHLSAWMRARPHEFESQQKRAEAAEGEGETGSRGPLGLLWKLAKRTVRIGLDTYRRIKIGAGGGGRIERGFHTLAARGVAVSIVLSEGDKSESELELHTGPDGERIAGLPGVEILRIPNADHSLSPVAARRKLARHLIGRLAGDDAAGGAGAAAGTNAPARRSTSRSATGLLATRGTR